MSRIRSKDTSPELEVRKALTDLGVRYRLHKKLLAGTPDIVIAKLKTAVFVNGCFWHQHNDCKRSTLPKTNKNYWHAKLERNIHRQKDVLMQLQSTGWKVIIIWECETKNDKAVQEHLRKELDL